MRIRWLPRAQGAAARVRANYTNINQAGKLVPMTLLYRDSAAIDLVPIVLVKNYGQWVKLHEATRKTEQLTLAKNNAETLLQDAQKELLNALEDSVSVQALAGKAGGASNAKVVAQGQRTALLKANDAALGQARKLLATRRTAQKDDSVLVVQKRNAQQKDWKKWWTDSTKTAALGQQMKAALANKRKARGGVAIREATQKLTLAQNNQQQAQAAQKRSKEALQKSQQELATAVANLQNAGKLVAQQRAAVSRALAKGLADSPTLQKQQTVALAAASLRNAENAYAANLQAQQMFEQADMADDWLYRKLKRRFMNTRTGKYGFSRRLAKIDTLSHPLAMVNGNLQLQIQPVYFNPNDYTPDSVMSEVARRLTLAGRQARPILKFMVRHSGQRAQWNTWLPRHRIMLRAPLANEPRRSMLREQFYYNIQQQLLLFSEQADQLATKRRQPSAAPTTTIAQAVKRQDHQAQPDSSQKADPSSVLYDHEFKLPIQPTRIMRVTLSDRGSSATAQNNSRYLICVRYSTAPTSKYQGLNTADGCPAQMGYVTASIDAQELSRELFIEKVVMALDTNNLKMLANRNGTVIKPLQQASARYIALQDSLTKIDAQIADTSRLQRAIVVARQDSGRTQRIVAAFQIEKDTMQQHIATSHSTLRNLAIAGVFDTTSVAALKGAGFTGQLDSLARDSVQVRQWLRKVQTYQDKRTKLLNDTIKYQATHNKALDELLKKLAAAPRPPKRQPVDSALQIARRELADAQSTSIAYGVSNKELLNITQDTVGAAGKVVTTADATLLRNELTEVYLDYLRQQIKYSEAPIAGVVIVSPKTSVFNLPKDRHFPAVAQGEFLLDELEMKVEDGSIVDLKATGSIGGKPRLFESHTPIGISSDADLNNRHSWYKRYLWSQAQSKSLPRNHHLYIHLDELLLYFPSTANEDRSPANNIYIFHPNDPLVHRTLRKEPTAKILQARIYSDLAGVEGTRPNGLVQVEIAKKIVFGSPWSRNSPGIQFRAVGYITPLVAITKLEQQNRYLPLEYVDANPAAPFYRLNTIDLLRYTNLRVGVDLNLVGMRLPQFKSDYSLDFSFYLNRVDIRDTLRRNRPAIPRVDSAVNVANYGLNLKCRIRPDSRYGVQLRLGYLRYALINSASHDGRLPIQQTPAASDIHAGAHTFFGKYLFQGVFQYEMLGWLNLSENSMFFVRPQFSHLLFQAGRTYFQLQVGYQFDVFTRQRDAPVNPPSLFQAPL
jgi:hypothetical protein